MKLLKEFVPEPIESLTPAASVDSEEEIIAKKEQFAELLLKNPDNPFAVACIVFPNDTGKALRISNEWPNDPEVKTLMQSLQDAGEEFQFHPTKEQFARKLLNTAEQMLLVDPMTAHKYHDSYRKMRWPDAGINITDNRVTNNVMVVPKYKNEEDWEKQALSNQRKLKDDSIVSTVKKIN